MSILSNVEINDLYEQNIDRIYRFFFYKFLDKVIAEDCTSEVFLTFVRKVKELTKIDEPNKYLFGIAKLVFLRRVKRKYIDKLFMHIDVSDFQSHVTQFEETVESKPTIEEFAASYIDHLPEKQKQVAKMRLIDKMGLDEICQKLNKDMNYVKTTQKRALAGLRKLIACTP